MSKHTALLDDNESILIASVSRGTEMDRYEISVFVGLTGDDFGSGTVTIQASPDKGVTKTTLKDVAGTVVSITENDIYNISLGYAGKLGQEIDIYATMAGGTTPNVNIVAFDNR